MSPHKDLLFQTVSSLIDNLNDTSREIAEEALRRCHNHVKHCRIVEKIAQESGIKLSGFLFNKDLELYYDITWHKRDTGFISRGWTEPGYRVGNLVIMPVSKSERFEMMEILNYCSGQGVVCTGTLRKNGYELMIDQTIYEDGFNKKVLRQAVKTIEDCAKKIRNTIRD